MQFSAQLSLLEPTAARLRVGERIPPQELDKIMKLARSHRAAAPEEEGKVGGEISWREVMLGRKKDGRAEVEEERRRRAEEWDRKDLEAGECRSGPILRRALTTVCNAFSVQKEVQSSRS